VFVVEVGDLGLGLRYYYYYFGFVLFFSVSSFIYDVVDLLCTIYNT
jgi:hypothetical protein